jgi:FkbM family methyltransferase
MKLKSIAASKIRQILGVDRLRADIDRLKLEVQCSYENHFLNSISGVIHVGANAGQERDLYDGYGLRVLWIEPAPEVFRRLQSSIANYKRQQCIQALITDVDNREYDFHLANNDGQSSSILEFKGHKDLWPEIGYLNSITLKGRTLPSLLDEHNINPAHFEALVMDTQGSELLVLKGADSILNNFRFISTEVADFESYAGCCTVDEIDSFLKIRNFRRHSCRRDARMKDGGAYYTITYQNVA